MSSFSILLLCFIVLSTYGSGASHFIFIHSFTHCLPNQNVSSTRMQLHLSCSLLCPPCLEQGQVPRRGSKDFY